MPFFYHPDLKTQYFHFQFLSQGVTNIYQYVSDHKSTLGYIDTFNYLPLTYFTFGTYYRLINILRLPELSSWVNNWGTYQNSYPNLPLFLLSLKLPYLAFDLLLGYYLYKIYKNRQIVILWFFNPISIYLIYILGNFDILPVLLTVMAYYYLSKKPPLTYLLLGIAIALKLYPIILLPFFLFHRPYNWRQMILNIILTTTPLLTSILPLISNHTFWVSFFGSGLTQKLLEFRLLQVPVFPITYVALLFSYIKSQKFENTILYLLIMFVTQVNFHPQWLLWFFPFIIHIFYQKPKTRRGLIILSIFIFFYILSFNDQYLFWGHLTPIDPNFPNIISPYQILFQYFGDKIAQIHLTYLHLTFPVIYYILIRRHESSK